jgi:hypothetical protein
VLIRNPRLPLKRFYVFKEKLPHAIDDQMFYEMYTGNQNSAI